jgi:hypothetical protein
MSKNDTRTINIKKFERGGSMEELGGMWRCQHSHRLTDGGGAQPALWMTGCGAVQIEFKMR